jgi:hypothetical protein
MRKRMDEMDVVYEGTRMRDARPGYRCDKHSQMKILVQQFSQNYSFLILLRPSIALSGL